MVQEKPFVSVAMSGPRIAVFPREAMSMFHSDTQALIELWSRMARDESGRARVPERRQLRPEMLGGRLARAFLAERSGQLRLVGSWIEALHQRPMTESSWLTTWQDQSRTGVQLALQTTLREVRPLVLEARIASVPSPLELSLVPLRDEAGRIELVLGLYVPQGTFNLAQDADRSLALVGAQPVGEAGRANLSLASLDGRRIA